MLPRGRASEQQFVKVEATGEDVMSVRTDEKTSWDDKAARKRG
jgi:hypothetical protein